MARIIRGSFDALPRDSHLGLSSRIIDGGLYNAVLESRQMVANAEEQREAKLADARQAAALLEDKARQEGFAKACSEAAQKAIQIGLSRHERILAAKVQIMELALEITKKVLGAPTELSEQDFDAFMSEALHSLKKQKRLRLEGERATLEELKDIASSHSLELHETSDIPLGQVKVVTEFGPIPCALKDVIDAFQQSPCDG